MYEPIAIIGYGVLYPPNSDNVQNFWKNIKNGVQGIREVTNEVWNVNDYYNEKGADNIFFGPNFRNISNVRVDNSKKISIGDINVTDESKVFNFINNIDSKINPILIDNVGRLMLLNEFYQNGNTVVPTFISKTISLESFNIGEKVKAYVEKVAENGDEVIYDAFVFNESKLLLIIEQMHLTKVGQTSDYEIEI